MIEQAPRPLRWPMYVRNVKQLLRAADSGFDERRYGFGGILDLLRASQRDALLRLERDRQGVLRVFPGAALQRPAAAPPVQEATIEEPVAGLPGEAPGDERAPEAVEPAEAPAHRALKPPAVIDAETIETPVPEAVARGTGSRRAAPSRRSRSAGARRRAARARPRRLASRGLPPSPRGRRRGEPAWPAPRRRPIV